MAHDQLLLRAIRENSYPLWHMAETLAYLISHLKPSSKIVVWAHNSHFRDARATEVSRHGELNVGQLVRNKYGNSAELIGFTAYNGTVTAASDWDGPPETKQVRPALTDSFKALFHGTYVPEFLIILRGNRILQGFSIKSAWNVQLVIYLPQSERVSHCFRARLAEQFDAVIHIDQTDVAPPVEITSAPEEAGEVPEMYASVV